MKTNYFKQKKNNDQICLDLKQREGQILELQQEVTRLKTELADARSKYDLVSNENYRLKDRV